MRRVALVVLLVIAAGCSAPDPRAGGEKPTLILISFDGWRWDYGMKGAAPNLERLIPFEELVDGDRHRDGGDPG
jgi:hypothetical protein